VEDGAQAGSVRRVNLYYPDRIEKYVSSDDVWQGIWRPYLDGETELVTLQDEAGREYEAAVLWWTDTGTQAGEPLGVPVIHFRNKDQGYNFGQSELKNVVPLQNALNKSLIDLLAAADTTAFRVFWMLGDDPSALELAPGSWIYSERPPSGDDGVQVGMFPGEDLKPLISLSEAIGMEIAKVSRTPLSLFQISGQVAAEGTLKQQESGLVAKARDRQVAFGNAWEDAMHLARRLANVFGLAGLDEDQTIAALWADPETRNEKEHLETLSLKAGLGVPQERLWREMGYNADEIAEMRAMRGEELAQQSNVGGELLRAFEQGF
jgi:hypothetical protein